MKSLILVLTFLTRIPYPVRLEFDTRDFAKGIVYMPLVGLIIGIPLYVFAYFTEGLGGTVRAFVLILIYLALTGGLHLDGLGDYWDGMFSGRTRERILEIMKDSSMGTFGVIGLVLYFLGFYTGAAEVSPVGLLLMPVVGRVAGLCLCAFGAYPREAGMGQAFVDYAKAYHGFTAIVVMMLIAFWAGPIYLAGIGVVLILMSAFFVRTTQVIGGITGDVIGASVETTQVLWLLALVLLKGVF